MKIETKRKRIEAKIEKLEAQLLALQNEVCEHNTIEYRYCGNTGNYDPHADCYWVEVRCLDCGKSWHDDDQYHFNTWKRQHPEKNYTQLPGKSY